MRRLIITATVATVLAAMPLAAQTRPVRFPAGSFGHASCWPFCGGFVFGQDPRFHIVFGPPFFHNPFFFNNPFFFHHPFSFPQPFIVPVPFYGSPSYPTVVQTAPQVADTSGQREMQFEIERLREEIERDREERLRDEVERLREEREFRYDRLESPENPRGRENEEGFPPRSRWRAQPGPKRTTPEEVRPIILVYRNGRRLEVLNYAVIGQTLWDFSEQHARKVLLSELDLDATARLNEERGVEFPLPGSQKSE